MKRRSLATFLTLLLSGLLPGLAHAWPPEFGHEFTFTNEAMLAAMQSHVGFDKEVNIAAQKRWQERITQLCETRKNCTVTSGTDNHGRTFKVTYEDGWWYEVGIDVGVLEVKGKPETVNGFKKQEARVQKEIFDFAAENGLTPHERTGGGHISVGQKSAFDGDARLFRDFVVDQANHPELADGIFGNHLGNAPPVSALRPEDQKAFAQVITEFDRSPTSVMDLGSAIAERAYQSNPFNWDRSYQAVRVSKLGRGRYPDERAELRAYRPQRSAREYRLQTELIEKRLQYLKERAKKGLPPLEVRIPPSHKIPDAEKYARFQSYLKEMGETPEIYAELVPQELRVLSKSTIPAYDEAIEAGKKGIREAYDRIYPIYQSVNPRRRAEFERKAMEIGSDNRRLLPIPRIVTRSEHETILAGAKQRAKALWAFYKDSESALPKISIAGIIPKEIVWQVQFKYRIGNSRPVDGIGYYYGPDLVRGPDGKFMVLEDNFGNPGGMADATQSRKDLLSLLPEYGEVLSADKGKKFAETAVEALRKIAIPPDGALIALLPKQTWESNKYFVEQLRSQGVLVHAVEDVRLTVKGGQVFVSEAGGLRKVGGVLFRSVNPEYFAGAFPAVHEALKTGRVASLGGLESFLGDKELTQHVEDMVRFYLHEEPILKSVPSFSFRDPKNVHAPSPEAINKVFSHLDSYVIKETAGAGGEEAWLGNRLKSKYKVRTLRSHIERYPGRFIAQEYVPISMLEDHLVDIRPLLVVTDKGAWAADHLFGRSLHVSGDGRLNMTQQGGGVAVFTEGVDTLPLPTGSGCVAARIREFRLRIDRLYLDL